jgi:ribosome maturation factor RimP
MAVNDAIVERVRSIAENAAGPLSVELVHVEIMGSKRDSVVRVYIDKEGGVTLDDCALFSGVIEKEIEAQDLIPWAYVLEVSSPGIERGLYSIGDFEKFKGELIRLKSRSELDGQRNFSGTIEGVENDVIVIEDRTKGTVRIPYSEVEKANLKMDLGKELKGPSAR